MLRTPFLTLLALAGVSQALLEEKFVIFKPATGAVPIHNASIIYAGDDPVGVKIAATSLADDLASITGNTLTLTPYEGGDAGTAPAPVLRPQNADDVVFTVPMLEIRVASSTAILAGTVDSALIRRLVENGKLDVSDIQGKWESFKTTVVEEPLPGFSQALVIAGSDKRAVMFGLYTLSEQCGQSP